MLFFFRQTCRNFCYDVMAHKVWCFECFIFAIAGSIVLLSAYVLIHTK